MKQPVVLVMLIAFIAVISFVVASQQAKNDGGITATLTGANEVGVLGDADGSGIFRFTIKNQEQQLCYELNVSNISPATSSTINAGASGSNGKVVLNLITPANGRSQGCTSSKVDVLADIAANPNRYYVNVTNAEFPNGAIRGQLK
jgi:hypothetical protein